MGLCPASIHKWSDDELFALNVETFAEQHTIWKFTNDWKIKQRAKIRKWLDDKLIAMSVERFGKKHTPWKFTNN